MFILFKEYYSFKRFYIVFKIIWWFLDENNFIWLNLSKTFLKKWKLVNLWKENMIN